MNIFYFKTKLNLFGKQNLQTDNFMVHFLRILDGLFMDFKINLWEEGLVKIYVQAKNLILTT
jgi:hypothetical protein